MLTKLPAAWTDKTVKSVNKKIQKLKLSDDLYAKADPMATGINDAENDHGLKDIKMRDNLFGFEFKLFIIKIN